MGTMRFLPATAASAACAALAACGPNASSPFGNEAAVAANAAENASAPARDPMPRVLAAMAALLVDPESARYSNLRDGSVGSICGAVAVRQPDGGHAPPVPFVVTPEGAALVSATPRLAWEALEDPFPPAYARWCATPAELEQMRAAIAASPLRLPEQPPPADLPLGNETAPPPAPPEPPPRATPAPPRPPVAKWEPADPDDVSFTNAVRRADE
jgi:hypothetical protein